MRADARMPAPRARASRGDPTSRGSGACARRAPGARRPRRGTARGSTSSPPRTSGGAAPRRARASASGSRRSALYAPLVQCTRKVSLQSAKPGIDLVDRRAELGELLHRLRHACLDLGMHVPSRSRVAGCTRSAIPSRRLRVRSSSRNGRGAGRTSRADRAARGRSASARSRRSCAPSGRRARPCPSARAARRARARSSP